MEFFEHRCFPRDRLNVRQLLTELGLNKYDPYEIVRKTRGQMFDDYYWIRFDGDKVEYKYIMLRD
jgi:hypothetical protein